MSRKDSILVVGSINMDLVVRSEHMPQPGETILGDGFRTFPGGKGANQAVAAARLGARVKMIGRVGNDPFGVQLLASLQVDRVDCSSVAVTQDSPTGVAFIIVDANGENSIVVASGSNYLVTPDDDIFPHEGLFAQASVVVLQLELPLPTVRAAIEMARRHGCQILLDPAPAPRNLPEDLFNVDVFTPNIVEAETVTRMNIRSVNEDKLAASELIALGARNVVLKLGARGSLVVMGDGHFYTVPPYRVDVVDTTAAGDAFTGALAVAMSRGMKLRDAARFANAAGALACTKMGAQSGMPTLDEVEILMQDQRHPER